MDDAWVYVDFRKWPNKPHWHYRLFPLGEDAHGRWFALPAGSWLQRRPEPPVRQPRLSVVLIPSDAWWAATWNSPPGGHYEIYIDIATPARWQGNAVSMFDLDLDVVRDARSGAARIIDEDEFEEHKRTLGYPPDIAQGARRSADALVAAVAERREPFDRVGPSWLAQAGARSWPDAERWMDAP